MLSNNSATKTYDNEMKIEFLSKSKNEAFATIESVKAASEIYMPISGKVVEINEQIVNSPELLNDETFEDKWFVKIESSADQVEFADLLDYSDYKEEIE